MQKNIILEKFNGELLTYSLPISQKVFPWTIKIKDESTGLVRVFRPRRHSKKEWRDFDPHRNEAMEYVECQELLELEFNK